MAGVGAGEEANGTQGKWSPGTPPPPHPPHSLLSHESFAAPLISPPFPLLYENGCELCIVDSAAVLNKADNSNNKECVTQESRSADGREKWKERQRGEGWRWRREKGEQVENRWLCMTKRSPFTRGNTRRRLKGPLLI